MEYQPRVKYKKPCVAFLDLLCDYLTGRDA